MKHAPTIKPKRCAVYCRVSSDEGLSQSFNSIDAQKEAGHAFIKSQAHEGWIAVVDDYDDPAYSGGNMERPALKRLLRDIEVGKVDMIVIYKIDRLSRSLADFAKMVEIFDRNGVSFSAVTQQINSATSMGRLMLNVLLSFAQFEREVTSERIRDKLAASKAKGMFMGGPVPLGYRVENRRLWVVPEDAALVKRFFEDFVADPYVTGMVQRYIAEGITTRSGKLFSKQTLYQILNNRIYLGEITDKGKSYPGLHERIIEQPLWDAVHAILGIDKKVRGNKNFHRKSPPALLRGLVYAPSGNRMVPSYTTKTNSGGKRYRYYADLKYVRFGTSEDTFGSINAEQLEGVVVQQVLNALQSPASIQAVWDAVQATPEPTLDEAQVVVAMRNLGSIWPSLFPEEQSRIVNLLIRRVQFTADAIEIQWHPMGWQTLIGEFKPNSIGAELTELAETE
jgi:DNA invertase Pin-like site-specific DNA recombinase